MHQGINRGQAPRLRISRRGIHGWIFVFPAGGSGLIYQPAQRNTLTGWLQYFLTERAFGRNSNSVDTASDLKTAVQTEGNRLQTVQDHLCPYPIPD